MLTINIRTMNALKQVLGVDVAQKELVVTLGRLLENLSIELYAYKVFSNSEKGFSSLLTWTKADRPGHRSSVCNGSNGGLSSEICLFSG